MKTLESAAAPPSRFRAEVGYLVPRAFHPYDPFFASLVSTYLVVPAYRFKFCARQAPEVRLVFESEVASVDDSPHHEVPSQK